MRSFSVAQGLIVRILRALLGTPLDGFVPSGQPSQPTSTGNSVRSTSVYTVRTTIFDHHDLLASFGFLPLPSDQISLQVYWSVYHDTMIYRT